MYLKSRYEIPKYTVRALLFVKHLSMEKAYQSVFPKRTEPVDGRFLICALASHFSKKNAMMILGRKERVQNDFL